MSSVVITADIHFGVKDRLDDILWSCRVMREYCKSAGIDTVLILGDLFHDRAAIEIDVLSHVAKFFEDTKTKYGQQWIVFPGNHDMFLRHSWDISSLDIMRKHLTVIENLKILELDDKRFWVLPFITYEAAFMKALNLINKRAEDGDNLLTHIGVRGASMNTCFLLQDWSVVNFDHVKFNRVYTGHFHSRQQIGENCWYPGSPIPFKFDEGDVPHGFYVYNLREDSHKFINIWKAGKRFFPDEVVPPQFHTFLDELLDQKKREDIENNIIRVGLQREYTDDQKKEMKNYLMSFGARRVRWWDMNKSKGKEVEESVKAHTYNNLFKTFVENDAKGTKNLDAKVLDQRHQEVVREGDQEYTLEESEL